MKWSQVLSITERLLHACALKHVALDKFALSVSSAA